MNTINNTRWSIITVNSGIITKKMANEINKKYPFTACSGKYFTFFATDSKKKIEMQNFIISVFKKNNKNGSILSITDKQFGMNVIHFDTDSSERMFKGFNVFNGLHFSIRDEKYKRTIYYPITAKQKEGIISF